MVLKWRGKEEEEEEGGGGGEGGEGGGGGAGGGGGRRRRRRWELVWVHWVTDHLALFVLCQSNIEVIH